jgi:hypothetical protein
VRRGCGRDAAVEAVGEETGRESPAASGFWCGRWWSDIAKRWRTSFRLPGGRVDLWSSATSTLYSHAPLVGAGEPMIWIWHALFLNSHSTVHFLSRAYMKI